MRAAGLARRTREALVVCEVEVANVLDNPPMIVRQRAHVAALGKLACYLAGPGGHSSKESIVVRSLHLPFLNAHGSLRQHCLPVRARPACDFSVLRPDPPRAWDC